MKNLPDDIFRRKLEHLQTPPPARAWEQIEKGMRRKRITPWLAIAASLLLVITASALILTRQKAPDPQGIAGRQLPETSTTPSVPDTNAVIPPATANIDTTVVAEPETNPSSSDVPGDIPEATIAANAKSPSPEPVSDEEGEVTIDSLPAADDSIPSLIAEAPAQDSTAPVKIVLEADEVQARYLKRKTNNDATESVAKASGLRKLLDKAEQIQNQDHIGDLRQMKNEILALNFAGRKRDQNK